MARAESPQERSAKASAVRAAERAVAQIAQLRGTDHPETLVSRAQLARQRAQAGDTRGAIRDYENLLPDLMRAIGRDVAGTLDIGTAVPANPEPAGANTPRSPTTSAVYRIC